jgi:hypothetical protein
MSKHQHLTRAAEEPVKPPSKHKVDQKQSGIVAERRPYSHPRISIATLSRICFERRKTNVDNDLQGSLNPKDHSKRKQKNQTPLCI